MKNKKEDQSTCTQGATVQKVFRSHICTTNHPQCEADRLAGPPEPRTPSDTDQASIFSHEPLVEMEKIKTTLTYVKI